MTVRQFPSQAPLRGDAAPLNAHERAKVRAAAHHSRRVYPGPLGELVHRELTAYAEFGYRFAIDALVPRLATEILAMPAAAQQSA
jgi:hypothetical protein